ncbi:DinB family protein [Paenibacillus piri]|uniref:Damage-inducible protein DinB n=1 Tax=Paenibacillus piri TaxID=2547395 RepID=A0A4R5KKB5_9BACL|nr:DinB family protein [Paenibacillus piri]TDF94800.1 hypothetical protein E1757_22880 [Paenibacillus piri]
MYTTINDFAEEWDREFQLTEEVLNALTDASLQQPVANERRTLGQIAWHLVMSVQYMTYCGLVFDGLAEDAPVPESAAVIAQNYRKIGRSFLNAVKAQWSDEQLLISQNVMGEEWKNGATLRFILMHQSHHRGQMTVLMRQAGLRIPEVYGPTYDTWVDKGVAPLA